MKVPLKRSQKHEWICKGLTSLYITKNKKYGNSFGNTFKTYGPAALLLRLEDKLNRAKTLLLNPEYDPGDESIRDTLVDLANYTIMGIMELDELSGIYQDVEDYEEENPEDES